MKETTSRIPFSRRSFGASVLGAAALAALAPAEPAASAQSAAGGFRLIPDPSSRTTGRDFFGVNGARIISARNAEQWHDPAFLAALAAVGPGLIRVQGGLTSQWIDWRTGFFDEERGDHFAGRNEGRPPLTLADWAEITRVTGTTPVFDLNVVTSTLDEQLAMLREAQRLGMPVRWIELGNEIWLPMPEYTSAFPTGAEYAHAMNDWISALRHEFPQARIGVPGADPSSLFAALGDRLVNWNTLLYSTIRDADAVTFHPYWIVDPLAGDIGSTAVGGVVQWNQLAHLLSEVPAGMEVWFTEYNQLGREAAAPLDRLPAVRQTWAVGLSVAAFTLRALLDPRTGMALMHCALNGEPAVDTSGGGTTNQAVHALVADGSGGSQLYGRTALSWALGPIYRSMAAETTVRALRIDPDVASPAVLLLPVFAGAAAAFTGAELSTAELTTGILLNASDQPLRITLPPSLVDPDDTVVYWAAPTAAPAFTPGDTVAGEPRTVADVIDLPPYSEAVLRKTRR